MSDLHKTRDEVSHIMAKHLHVTEKERVLAEKQRYWPIIRVLPFIFHKDYAIRRSAVYFLEMFVRRRLSVMLRPLVSFIRRKCFRHNSKLS